MQVAEDMKECILSLLLVNQILYIINNQHIDALIEMNEVVDATIARRYGKLTLKQTLAYIKHTQLRTMLLQTQADGMHEMSLANTRGPEYEQRVESLVIGISTYGFTD